MTMNIYEFLSERYVLPKKVRLFEAFAGIGCQHMAFNRLGIEVEMVGISEIDKYAIASYNAIHGQTKNWGSICDIKGQDLPEIDVFTWSFPCTDLSKAGKQKGLTNTRSGLVYEVLRILREATNKPKVLIMENVVDLVQSKFIREFNEIQAELERLGYENHTQTINAKDYGVAQNRDRVFMVSILGGGYYEFPKPFKLEKRLKDYLEESVDERYYLSAVALSGITNALERNGKTLYGEIGKEELSVIQYPRGENAGGLISNITSPTIDGAIGSRNTALLCVKEKVYQGVVDEKYYLSEKAISGLNRADEREHTPTWLNDESLESPCIDTRVGALTHWSPYVKENERYIQWDNTGKGHNSQAWIAYHTDGNICTISASNANVDKTQIIEPQVINPLKDISNYGWHFEQNVYDDKGITRALKSSEGSGNVPKVIEPVCLNSKVNGKQPSLQDRVYDSESIATAVTTGFMPSVTEPKICDFRYDEGFRSREEDDISPTLPATHLGSSSMSGQPFVKESIRIRKLTPRECWRLMGIDDSDFDKASQVCSNSQLYKQAGNGIVVDVFAEILKAMVAK